MSDAENGASELMNVMAFRHRVIEIAPSPFRPSLIGMATI